MSTPRLLSPTLSSLAPARVSSQADRHHSTCSSPSLFLRAFSGASGCAPATRWSTTPRTTFNQAGQEPGDKRSHFSISRWDSSEHVLQDTSQVSSRIEQFPTSVTNSVTHPVNMPISLILSHSLTCACWDHLANKPPALSILWCLAGGNPNWAIKSGMAQWEVMFELWPKL